MSRVLVTGANGQLGKSIQKRANDFKSLQFFFHNSATLDITNTRQINELFSISHFDYCINCAAYTNVEQAEKSPNLAFAINAEAVHKLALACSVHNVILVHISTDYVFDGEKETPYTVADKTNPINEYGKSKLEGEQYIQKHLKEYFIVRTSWLYSEFGKNFYKTILQKAKEGVNLRVTDNQLGCPTHARNLVSFVLELISANATNYGIHHFTDGEAMTWHQFAAKILRENGLQNQVRLEVDKNYRTFAKRPKNSVIV